MSDQEIKKPGIYITSICPVDGEYTRSLRDFSDGYDVIDFIETILSEFPDIPGYKDPEVIEK